ncbi:MucR family transcriptional regulator [Methylobacterium sp. WL30]|uniref:MucR family transcriptional regulator n=1 Tax=unclassified Methylobacterium TaxID=2615210 RepID=UPI0011C7D9B4|nr:MULTISPECIES: MucR family transcriptional regulator [unclassified Methylobacterium]TXN38974.1 MucR family transcriptional regulator [Methylobacterium sp. WL93]TXN52261.1 MucR family transcriptional regulator [Methylobacterium sp. WL119]TXN70656.1 MucR family transcriptional regulator [Methylobacterium sp. WL30]
MSSQAQPIDLTSTTAQIAAAYVSRNHVQASELPGMLRTIHGALAGLGQPAAAPAPAKPTEAQIRASIRPDALVSFEDGKPYKALRRHLTLRGLSPADYRRKHGLPIDYPMTSADYSARRSAISQAIQVGRGAPVLQAAE